MIYDLNGEPAITGTGINGAVADGVTDDTDALTAALNQSNTIVDGGNKRYKYMSLRMENVENLTVKNVIFWKGQNMDVAGCKNIRFENCTWEGVNPNGSETVWTYGIRLMERRDEAGNEVWCENIWIEGCTFRDIAYNRYLNNGHGNEISGEGILPRSVHKLFIKHNYFTQVQSSCVHWNTYKKCGYAEISDNTFYLNGMGGVCIYAVQQQFPKVKGKLCNNQFIGCGLGKMPDYFFDAYPPEQQGLGCAALLGGAPTRACPYKWQFAVENNVFEDNVESSIEGPTWNPCIGNSITGQGAIQTEENCRKMEEKYHLDYKLHLRVINSVNFIYRNYYRGVDDTFPNEDDEPIVYQNNTMGTAHVARSSYIHFKGEYNCPFVFTGNVMRTNLTQGLDTHFLFCNFKNGIRFENNDGIHPYFNSCTFAGDVVLDDVLSAYRCDFTAARLTLNQSRRRFPETWFQLYDPTKASLENDQATVRDGYALLTAANVYEAVDPPEDTAYDIQDAKGYSLKKGYVFGGPKEPVSLDTGIELLKDGGDWTIWLKFDGKGKTDIPSGNSGIMSLFTVYDSAANANRLQVGGQWGCFTTALRTAGNTVALESKSAFPLKNMKMLMCKSGNTIRTWLSLQDAEADAFTDYLVNTYTIQDTDKLSGVAGTLHVGTQLGYMDGNMFALYGAMREFQVFQRALTDDEIATLFYGHPFGEEENTETHTPIYDIANDRRYDQSIGAMEFDGTFGVDTGIELFKDDHDFTVLCKFRFDSFHDDGLKNFTFVPALSCLNYSTEADFKTKSPGIDVGLFLVAGEDPETRPTGGFIDFRNSWKLSNPYSIDMSSYFGYCNKDYDVVLMRKDGELSVYNFYMQRYVTVKGADVNTIFNGTLRIGENLTTPPLGENVRFRGKVYECRVYDAALGTSELENMFPNIYSNEKKTKGEMLVYVTNPQYKVQNFRYLYLEVVLDLGEFGSPEYAGKYPKAVGIKFNGMWGLDDVFWIGTGSNPRLTKWIYNAKVLQPYQSISVSVVNTGLCPKLEAKVLSFRCSVMTEVGEVAELSDAMDFDVAWDKDDLSLAVGETLTGHVTYLPEDANTGTSLTVTVDGKAATAEFAGNILTITGAQDGQANVIAALPSGARKVFTVTVGTGIDPDEPSVDPIVPVESVSLSDSTLDVAVSSRKGLTATVLPDNATDKTVTWSVTPAGIVTLSATTGERVKVVGDSAGTATVTAQAGDQSAICTVTVTENGGLVADVPGEIPVYKLAEAKTFVPANKEYIDTGIKMFESIDPKPDWTILFEVQYGENVTTAGNKYVLMHCMNEVNPWPGLAIQVVGDGYLQANIYGGKASFASLNDLKAKAWKFALRISGTTATRWASSVYQSEVTITNYNTAVSQSLLLGCYQESDGTKGRFFDGTLYQCMVFHKALTNEQVETWLKG